MFVLRLHISVIVFTWPPRQSNNDTHGCAQGHTLPDFLSGKLLYSLSKQDLKREEENTWKSGNNEFYRVVKLTSQAYREKSPNNSPEGVLKGRLVQTGMGWSLRGPCMSPRAQNKIRCCFWDTGSHYSPSWCKFMLLPQPRLVTRTEFLIWLIKKECTLWMILK